MIGAPVARLRKKLWRIKILIYSLV
jgi:hypothetical protein